MWNRATGWCVAMALSGCLRDPDPGGQEGEEVRFDGESTSPMGEVDSGTLDDETDDNGDGYDSDTGEDGTTEEGGTSGSDPGTDALRPDEWVGWTGTFQVERGSSTDPDARDCVLVFDMQGLRADECTDCLAEFTVRHELVLDSSYGQDLCADIPASFTRDYVVRAADDGGVALYVEGPDASLTLYGEGDVVDNVLSWSVGSVAIPSTSDANETVYRTDVETGVAQLD